MGSSPSRKPSKDRSKKVSRTPDTQRILRKRESRKKETSCIPSDVLERKLVVSTAFRSRLRSKSKVEAEEHHHVPVPQSKRTSKRLATKRLYEMERKRKEAAKVTKIMTRTVEQLPTVCNSSHPSGKLSFMIALGLTPKQGVIQPPYIQMSQPRNSSAAGSAPKKEKTEPVFASSWPPVKQPFCFSEFAAASPVIQKEFLAVKEEAEELCLGPVYNNKPKLEKVPKDKLLWEMKNRIDLPTHNLRSSSKRSPLPNAGVSCPIQASLCCTNPFFIPKIDPSSMQNPNTPTHYHHYIVGNEFLDEHSELVLSPSCDIPKLVIMKYICYKG